MRVVATTVLYDGIPRVVQVDISGHEEEDARYLMKPDVWARIEPGYAEQWDCIVEYRHRPATEIEVESVKKVIQDWHDQHCVEANLGDPDVSGLDLNGTELTDIEGYFDVNSSS